MSRSLRISDHAVLRYMARAQGIDVEAVRREIAGRVHRALDRLEADPGLQTCANAVQSGGMTYRIEADVVVTCVPTHQRGRGHG